MTCLPDGWLKEVHDVIRPLSLQVGIACMGHFIAKNNRRNSTGFIDLVTLQLCYIIDSDNSANHKGN